MQLYTFFLDYRGGTYVSQVSAPSPALALKVWAETLSKTEIEKLGPKSKSDLIEKVQLDTPTALEGIKHTWCCSIVLRGHLALIHFTQTPA
jgi:hypothetical protein